MKFSMVNLGREDRQKVKQDLKLIELCAMAAEELDYRLVVTNGYAVEGNLGQVTRPHRDVDLVVHINKGDPEILMRKLVERLNEDENFGRLKLVDKGRQEFYHWFFVEGDGVGADVYVVRVKGDLVGKTKVVKKKDGSWGEPHEYESGPVELMGVRFEVVNTQAMLRTKLKKWKLPERRKYGNDEQDIVNLKKLLEE